MKFTLKLERELKQFAMVFYELLICMHVISDVCLTNYSAKNIVIVSEL